MGDSAKLGDSGPDRYTFVEHRRYLDELLDELGVRERATLVGHDWGAALAFDWANRHRQAVKGIAYMEAVVRPLVWSDWPETHRGIFQALRSPAGEELILTGAQRAFCRTWPNQAEVTVPGIHFVQEDSPDRIGEALSAWYRTLTDGRAASGADAQAVSPR